MLSICFIRPSRCFQIHLSSLLRSVTSRSISCSTTNVLVVLRSAVIYYRQRVFQPQVMRHLLSGVRGKSVCRLHVHASPGGNSTKHFHVLFLLSRTLRLSQSVRFPLHNSSPLSSLRSRKMSWMKMCFMSCYTILLFSISKFGSVFI